MSDRAPRRRKCRRAGSKAGNEGVGAENEILVLRRAAVERDTVEHAGVGDVHGVAVLRGTLHGDEAGVLLAQALDVTVNLFVGDFNGGLLRLKALYWPRVTSG